MADNKSKLPAGAAAPPNGGADGITRRQALRSGMFATIGAFFSTVAGGSGAMFWPIKLTGFGSVVPVTKKASEFNLNDPPFMVRDGKFYVTLTNDGFMALYWKCVHLGCTVPWNPSEAHFLCPCHASKYALTGQNVAGPAPRPLDYMELEIKDDVILVNTGKINSRSRHEPGHAKKA